MITTKELASTSPTNPFESPDDVNNPFLDDSNPFEASANPFEEEDESKADYKNPFDE